MDVPRDPEDADSVELHWPGRPCHELVGASLFVGADSGRLYDIASFRAPIETQSHWPKLQEWSGLPSTVEWPAFMPRQQCMRFAIVIDRLERTQQISPEYGLNREMQHLWDAIAPHTGGIQFQPLESPGPRYRLTTFIVCGVRSRDQSSADLNMAEIYAGAEKAVTECQNTDDGVWRCPR
jgi:hypothetical protein